MKALELLTAAKALIDTPEKWTQKVAARDAEGKCVMASDSRAVCFCSLGALSKAYTELAWKEPMMREIADHMSDPYNTAVINLATGIKEVVGYPQTIGVFNDSTTHEGVIKVFDFAIQKAQNETL